MTGSWLGHAKSLWRHQLAALFATLADFGAMIALVSAAGESPVAATAMSASLGAVVNFLVSRYLLFSAHDRSIARQALRYGMVALGSAGLNVVCMYVVADRLHVQYVLARATVGVAVSVAWNYPMHSLFVFKRIHAT